MASASFPQSAAISAGGWMARTLASACCSRDARPAGSLELLLNAGDSSVNVSVASLQNSAAAAAVVGAALLLEAAEVLDDELLVLAPPPQAARAITAAIETALR